MKQFRIWIDNNWRAVLSRAPLPMLALAASWGVYSFAAMYVPQWVAIVQAAAFELTYIGLAITRGLTEEQRKRATAISIGAVVVSVLYNSIDGFFVRNPTWLIGLPWEAEALGAFLHGAPLAIVAYLVADLLLHSGVVGSAAHEDDSYIGAQPNYVPARVPDQVTYPTPVKIAFQGSNIGIKGMPDSIEDRVCPGCGRALDAARYGAAKRWGHCRECKPSATSSGSSPRAVLRPTADEMRLN